MLHHYTEPTSRKQFKITNDVELNYTARVAEPVKGEANLQEEVDSTTRRGVAVDGVEDGQGVVATVQTLTATIDPHQQQTATIYDKLMVLQGSWFAGYWFP